MSILNVGAASATAVQPGGMRSATEFGLVRNLMESLGAPGRAESRALMDIMQQPKAEALETLMNMQQKRAASLGPRKAIGGAPGGAVATHEADLMSGR